VADRAALVPFETLGRQGRWHVSTYVRPEWIERVMGEPARAHPIRVFVGLDSAATERERVDLALAELERTGGLDRSVLLMVSPTGTGYVNYAAVEATEYLTRGDCATVTLQYSKRPSPLSLGRVDEGRRQNRALFEAVHDRLQRPLRRRPRVVLFGESLGAHTSQDAFLHEGTKGLVDLGIDRALWIGTPYASEWQQEVLHDDGPGVDRDLVARVNDHGGLEALGPKALDGVRYVMLTHHNDAVAYFGLDLLLACLDWLGEPETRPPGVVPRTERYGPIVTFLQTLVDMKNSAKVVPGVFEAKGHDYRADLGCMVRTVYGLDATADQMGRIEEALRAFELRRAEWIREHHRATG
jgi:uncharacterized membrane protein